METKFTSERDRIEQLMQTEGLNAVQFANETGLKSATLSHILNGRNNPSLDVMKRILDRYRSVSSDWLFLGIGQMYRQKTQPQTLSLFENNDETRNKSDNYMQKKDEKTISENINIQENQPIKPADVEVTSPSPSILIEKSKSIEKIIVYFTDNTFEEFHSK